MLYLDRVSAIHLSPAPSIPCINTWWLCEMHGYVRLCIWFAHTYSYVLYIYIYACTPAQRSTGHHHRRRPRSQSFQWHFPSPEHPRAQMSRPHLSFSASHPVARWLCDSSDCANNAWFFGYADAGWKKGLLPGIIGWRVFDRKKKPHRNAAERIPRPPCDRDSVPYGISAEAWWGKGCWTLVSALLLYSALANFGIELSARVSLVRARHASMDCWLAYILRSVVGHLHTSNVSKLLYRSAEDRVPWRSSYFVK